MNRCKEPRKKWTLAQGKKFLNQIRPLLKSSGYKGRIIGSVSKKGYSCHDLDILLTPIRDDYNFEPIMEKLGGDFTMDEETYEHPTNDGKLVDFFFEEM